MREILFKAKRVDNGEWVEGYLFDDGFKNSRMFVGGLVIEEYKGTACDEWVISGIDFYEVDPSTICQYTGLTDKNGQKIWENDILLQKTTESHWCKWECIGVVKYGEHDWNVSEYGCTSIGFYIEPIVRKRDINKIACGLNQVDILDEHYPCEVIGNVFDNPELLEV